MLKANWFAAAIAVGCAASVQAAVVSYAGFDGTTGGAWRTASTTKTLDGDGNNVYGSAGYLIYGTATGSYNFGTYNVHNGAPSAWNDSYGKTLKSLPTGVSVTESSSLQTSINATGNAVIDNPAGSGTVKTGEAETNTSASTQTLLSISFTTANVPVGGYRIGVLLDNNDDKSKNPPALQLTQDALPNASAATNNLTTFSNYSTNASPGWAFFDISGLSGTSESFTLTASKSTSGAVRIGGLTFDAVPEPASLGLIGLAGTLLLRRRR